MPKVLIVTGGLLSPKEPNFAKAVQKQIASFRASSGAWLDVQIKLQAVEQVLAGRAFRKTAKFRAAPYAEAVNRFYSRSRTDLDAPELTEVSLMTLLAAEGIGYEAASYADLYADPALAERLLSECTCVFASTTLIRDLSELRPMIAMLKRPHNRVVAGGALAAILHSDFAGCEGLDVLAVGYGELLVPSIAKWIRGGFAELCPPPTGRMVDKAGTKILYSGVPATHDLDELPTPDWTLPARYHNRSYKLANYESVRGCPYRCAFCNYPYLFDDTKFRYRSAKKIAADWQALAEQGVEYISCLDSLFTMPKRRLVELCNLLIEREIYIKWICYARSDDLKDLETCRLMKRAGCHQVQIGFESGSQAQLDNMNKRNTVASNVAGIKNCRAVGITTLVTAIIGYPGETLQTLEQTLACLRECQPDVYYLAPFNTRVEYVPILSAESRARFGIVTATDGTSSAPYWKHDTMDCTEVVEHARWLNERMMAERISLEGTTFYEGLVDYDPSERDALLDFQRDAAAQKTIGRRVLRAAERFAHSRLVRDVEEQLGGVARPVAPPTNPVPASGALKGPRLAQIRAPRSAKGAAA